MLPASVAELVKVRACCKAMFRRHAVVRGVTAMMYLGNSHVDACYEIARGAIKK